MDNTHTGIIDRLGPSGKTKIVVRGVSSGVQVFKVCLGHGVARGISSRQ